MDKTSVLIIEDDKDISNLVSIHVKDLGFKTDQVFDGREGLLKALNEKYEIIVLDIMLPSLDGYEICKKLRQERVTTPILMLTSKSEEIDKVLGLEFGADDYLTKPFSIRELIARIKAILRRIELSKQIETNDDFEIHSHDLYINIGLRRVEVKGKRIELTPKEFELLALLASNPGKTFSRASLLSQIWGYEFEGFEHTVNSHVNRLRAKVEQNMNQPEYILTTWGVGYKFREN